MAVPSDQPDPDAVDRAAGLDDFLGGFTARVPPLDDGADADARPGDVGGLFDTILLLRQAAAADGVVPPAATPESPPRIGRYELLRLAGEGGFARVWEGFDTLLRRRVAVKIRRPEALLSESARRRFVREAEIAARLVHPHIVTIYEVGTDSGREFIAAEFCAGGSLAAWLERHPGPMPPRDAARLVRALAGAAAYAHAAGVVHRDIKPANILLVPAPAGTEPILEAAASNPDARPGFTVKLCDFGLGKLHDGHDADPLTQLTRSGTSIGTPAWMAPEQIDRSFGPVGPATDVHALGLLLDRLLTGRALRGGGTTAETYRQVLLDEATPADRVERRVPADLAAVGLKCLARRPADRYASATALADDLDRWLDGRPTHARPLSPAGQGIRWVRRRPVVAGLAAVAVAASLVALWAGVARHREALQSAVRSDEIRRQRAVTELRRGFEAMRGGNVAGALAQREAARGLDATLADSLAGRWLLRRTHGERGILLRPDRSGSPSATPRPLDLYSIAIAGDGDTAAVAGADGRVHLLRGLDGTVTVESVPAHDEVNDVAFSTDGTRLVTAGQDGRLRWWDIAATGLVATGSADPAAGPLYAATFTPDGDSIVCGGADRRLWLVPLDSPDRAREVFRFAEPPGKSPEIESLAFVDDRTVAAACGDLVVLVDLVTGRPVREFERVSEGNRNAVLGSLAVSPDGDRLMACGTDARAHIWSVATGRIEVSLPAHPAWVQGCCFLDNGDRVATACRDGGVRIFDAGSNRQLARLAGHEGRVWSIAKEPSGTLLTCGADGTVRRWDPEDGLETATLRTMTLEGGDFGRLAAGPAAGQVVVTLPYVGVRIIDIAARTSRAIGGEAPSRPEEIAVDRHRGRLAVSWKGQEPISVFDLAGRASQAPAAAGLPAAVAAHLDPSMALCDWTADGELLVCGRHGQMCLVAMDLGRVTPMASSLEDPVHDIAVAPAGTPRVAAAGKHATLLPLPGAAATPLELPVGEESSVVAWSPDATLVAYGTRTGRILLFESQTGAARSQFVPHQRDVAGLAFSKDGRFLVSADADCVRITDVATLTTLDEIRPGWQVKALQLTADDACMLLGGHVEGPLGPGGARLAVMEFDVP